MTLGWGWAFDGVNQTIPRNAGPDCSQYLSWQRQIIECLSVTTISVFFLHWTWKRLNPCPDPQEEHLLILQRRNYYDTHSIGIAGNGAEAARSRNAKNFGFFGNTTAPGQLLTQPTEKDKVHATNDGSATDVCNNCRVHVNINSHAFHESSSQTGAICAPIPEDKAGGHSALQNVHGHGIACGSIAVGQQYPGIQQLHQDGAPGINNGMANNVIVMCDNMFVAKQVLLVLMTFVLGLEIGFKFTSRTVIYLLNPCHITTIMQIYLLASKPSKFATAIFRIQMNYLNGPTLAFLFPETESRKIPMEAILYWVQHGLMFINSIYLLRLRYAETGVRQYSVQPLFDWTWNIYSYAWLMVYHFAFLVSLAIPTEVNLNHMLCPAVLDPFNGPNYRLIAVTHQAILCPLMCKTICWAFEPTEEVQRKNRSGMLSANDSESSLLVSSVSSISADALGVISPTSSMASSPSTEHPIQSLNRTEYLNLINDSEEEEASQRLISYEGDGHHHQVTESTPVKRSGGGGGTVSMMPGEDTMFSASAMMDRNFAEFLDKKQE